MTISEISPTYPTTYSYSTYNSIANIEPNQIIANVITKDNAQNFTQNEQIATNIKDYSSIINIDESINLFSNTLSEELDSLNDNIATMQIAKNAENLQLSILDDTRDDLIQITQDNDLTTEAKESLIEDIQNNISRLDDIARTTKYEEQTLLQANEDDQSASNGIDIEFLDEYTTLQTQPIQSNSQGLDLEELKDIDVDELDNETAQEYIERIDTAKEQIEDNIQVQEETLNQVQASQNELLVSQTTTPLIDTTNNDNNLNLVPREQIILDSQNFDASILAQYEGSLSQAQSNVSSIDEQTLLSDTLQTQTNQDSQITPLETTNDLNETNNIQTTTQTDTTQEINQVDDESFEEEQYINQTQELNQTNNIQTTIQNSYEEQFLQNLREFTQNEDNIVFDDYTDLIEATNTYEEQLNTQNLQNQINEEQRVDNQIRVNQDNETMDEVRNEIEINNQILQNNAVENSQLQDLESDLNTTSSTDTQTTTDTTTQTVTTNQPNEIENTTNFEISPAQIAQDSKDFAYQMILAQAGSLSVAQMHITLLQTNRLLEDDDS